MADKYDFILIGGGMVGLALAALVGDEFRIAVIDPQPLLSVAELGEEMDCRVSALSRASQNILRHCGAWEKIPELRRTPYRGMKVWEANGSSELSFDAQQLAEANLGHIVENQMIRSALGDALRRHADQVIVISEPLESIERDDKRVSCTLKNGQRLEAPLLVGADGALSRVRKAFSFELTENSYQQRALVANIRTELPHRSIAWQRFLTSGPVAYLPLSEADLCSIVWTLDNEKAQEVLMLPNDEQENAIARALDYRLGSIKLQTALSAFPLVARHATHYLQERVALIGDAAHTIHPLAGQGVNLGFLDAAVLAQRLLELKRQQRDWGLLSHLRPFERKRKGHNHLVQKSMTALNWVYQQQAPALVLARNMGINMINRFSPLKQQLVRQAMGMTNDENPFTRIEPHI